MENLKQQEEEEEEVEMLGAEGSARSLRRSEVATREESRASNESTNRSARKRTGSRIQEEEQVQLFEETRVSQNASKRARNLDSRDNVLDQQQVIIF